MLTSVRYQCLRCDGQTVFNFERNYRPFRRWILTCLRCGKYALHLAVSPKPKFHNIYRSES